MKLLTVWRDPVTVPGQGIARTLRISLSIGSVKHHVVCGLERYSPRDPEGRSHGRGALMIFWISRQAVTVPGAGIARSFRASLRIGTARHFVIFFFETYGPRKPEENYKWAAWPDLGPPERT